MLRKLGLLNFILKTNGMTFENIKVSGWDTDEVEYFLKKLQKDGFCFEHYFDENNHFSIRVDWKNTDLLEILVESYFNDTKDV